MNRLSLPGIATITLLIFTRTATADICTDYEQKFGIALYEAECYVLKQEEKDLSAREQKPFQVQQNLVRTTTRAAYRNGLRGVKDMKESHDKDVHLSTPLGPA